MNQYRVYYAWPKCDKAWPLEGGGYYPIWARSAREAAEDFAASGLVDGAKLLVIGPDFTADVFTSETREIPARTDYVLVQS